MKLTVCVMFLIFIYVLCGINYVVCEVTEEHARKFYDMHQLVREISEGIEVAETIDRQKDFLMSNNVEDKIKLLNFLNLIPVLIDSISNVTNNSCVDDLMYIKDNIDFKHYQDSWALKMLDSFGKPESGLLEGNVKWLGDFDECISVYAPKKVDSDIGGFHGQYCTLQVTVTEYLPLSIGVCLPDTCNPSYFKEILNSSNLVPKLEQSGLQFNVTSFTCKSNTLKLSKGGIAVLCIMSLFLFLVLMGSSLTAFKYFTDTNKEGTCNSSAGSKRNIPESYGDVDLDEPIGFSEGSPTKFRVFIDMCDPFLNCFCIFTNGSKLLNTDATEGQLMCLHGIRFLSMAWVILGHTYTSAIILVRSFKNVLPIVDNLPFQVVLNGYYSVDSFFVLSGFLMSYLYFQECAKAKGKTPWLYFYIHRYLRLTPVYMIVLAFYATVMHVMGSGPFWFDTNVDKGCQDEWWSNLIYINNFQQDASNQCMGWSWYLANDMQFFVISPLFLITLWRWPRVGVLISVFFLWVSWITGFLITYQYNLPAGNLGDVTSIVTDHTFLVRWNDYMQKIYIKPYTRIAPYIIGIVLGYILFKRKITGIKSSQRTFWIGWLLAVPTGLFCIYGYYHQAPNLLAASFTNALLRTVYGLSISWLIFACLSGKGGVVNHILSYKLFIPLSRLTYCAYLTHPIFVIAYFTTMKSTAEITHQTMVLWYLGLLTVTYAFSLLVSLTFESPLIRLEKLIRNKLQSK